MEARRIVVITGMAGAGRSTAAKALEDVGYFCVDNMPTTLLPEFARLCSANRATLSHVALVIDLREREFFETVTTHLEALTDAGLPYEILFLDATTDTMVARFSESRRRHPMADAADDLRGAIEAERAKVDVLRRHAVAVIDTSNLNVHELRDIIRQRYAERDGAPSLIVQVVSFGYKYGVPVEADLLFDVRFLPNPHYEPALRTQTGLDAPVRDFVLTAQPAQEFLDRVADLLAFLLPAYMTEGKTYLTIGIGCTGGRHRSVSISESLAERLRTMQGQEIHVQHRDLVRSGA